MASLEPKAEMSQMNLPSGAMTPATTVHETPSDSAQELTTKQFGGLSFWLIFIAMMVSTFLSALDFTSVATALPTIVEDLHGTEFVWIGSAFALGSTAFLPLSGGLAEIFGRRPVVLGCLAFFGLGSALAGAAQNMNMMIAARTIQGVGGGGILSLTEIVVADLVPLSKRGTYMGLIAAVWAVASAIGPPVGGAFSQSNWRWLFYINLPLTGIAMVLVFFFLRMKTPQDDLRTKLARMDWTGNFLVVVATTITVIALTWAGVKYPWSSYRVLVPLILGLVGLAAFFGYEFKFAKEPVVPLRLFSNRTSLFGYITTFLHSLVATSILYYLPVYFQGALLQGPIHSGVSIFGNSFTIAPFAMIAGASVAVFKVYQPQNFVGWALMTIGVGLLSLLRASTSKGEWVGFQLIEGVGMGILYSVTTFPVLAALPLNETAHALAVFTFLRTYAQTWGVTIGATILQNELKKKLPEAFLSVVSEQGAEIAYAIIPQVPHLPEPLRTQVREAFADSLKVIWYVMAAISAVGFLFVFAMKELPMADVTDENWGIEQNEKAQDVEKA
ncbi:hypothetical protein FRB99_002613 [Tulasnella sp. 403]|nr:hypothetical protein FRB99_002613 [Tulasnella sp. 403]